MVKKAYLVYGPESSGIKLMGRLLIEAGCIGDPSYYQRWEEQLPVNETPISWVRSFPLTVNHLWPSIEYQIQKLRELKYECYAIVMQRDWYSTAQSQVKRKHVTTIDQAYTNIRHANSLIITGLSNLIVPYEIVSYADLVKWKHRTLNKTLERIGLNKIFIKESIMDGNQKYYA